MEQQLAQGTTAEQLELQAAEQLRAAEQLEKFLQQASPAGDASSSSHPAVHPESSVVRESRARDASPAPTAAQDQLDELGSCLDVSATSTVAYGRFKGHSCATAWATVRQEEGLIKANQWCRGGEPPGCQYRRGEPLPTTPPAAKPAVKTAPVLAAGEVKPPQNLIKSKGLDYNWRGWYDAQGQGVANDYGRCACSFPANALTSM
jgi:hypothetical protein